MLGPIQHSVCLWEFAFLCSSIDTLTRLTASGRRDRPDLMTPDMDGNLGFIRRVVEPHNYTSCKSACAHRCLFDCSVQ